MHEQQSENETGLKLLTSFRQQRDEASFRALYRQHTPLLFGLATRLCGSRSTAEEITQEAWVRAVERIDAFDGRSRLSTWLAGILINCYRESRRQQAKAPESLDELGPGAEVIPAFPDKPDSRLETEDIEAALGGLAEGYREIIVLHDIYGYTHKEIASRLNIQEGTSKSQLARGRALLQAKLRPEHSKRSHRDERGAK